MLFRILSLTSHHGHNAITHITLHACSNNLNAAEGPAPLRTATSPASGQHRIESAARPVALASCCCGGGTGSGRLGGAHEDSNSGSAVDGGKNIATAAADASGEVLIWEERDDGGAASHSKLHRYSMGTRRGRRWRSGPGRSTPIDSNSMR